MRAEGLVRCYNNLTLEPLQGEEEFRDFYVSRPE